MAQRHEPWPPIRPHRRGTAAPHRTQPVPAQVAHTAWAVALVNSPGAWVKAEDSHARRAAQSDPRTPARPCSKGSSPAAASGASVYTRPFWPNDNLSASNTATPTNTRRHAWVSRRGTRRSWCMRSRTCSAPQIARAPLDALWCSAGRAWIFFGGVISVGPVIGRHGRIRVPPASRRGQGPRHDGAALARIPEYQATDWQRRNGLKANTQSYSAGRARPRAWDVTGRQGRSQPMGGHAASRPARTPSRHTRVQGEATGAAP